MHFYELHQNRFKLSANKSLALEEIHQLYFLIWRDTEENFNTLLKDFNKFHHDLRFTYKKSREKISFLDVVKKLKKVKSTPNCFASLVMVIDTFTIVPVLLNTSNDKKPSSKHRLRRICSEEMV